jgi:hypothetical protein
MDIQSSAFVRKFSEAQIHLDGSSIHDVVSLKYYIKTKQSDYRDLINQLKREPNLETRQIQGDFSGSAWLVIDNRNNKVILIEHENGLEILYTLGSIASLISLIPLIDSGWKFIHSRLSKRPFRRNKEMHVLARMLDSNYERVDQNISDVKDFIFTESVKEIAELRKRVERLE